MDATQLVTVGAGVVALLMVFQQNRLMFKRLLGNGDPSKPGKLEEVRQDIVALREYVVERNALVEERLRSGNGQFEELSARLAAFDARCATRHGEVVPDA